MFLGIIVAFIALSVMIFVHELFHLILAKWSKMNAPVFSIGLGPKLFSFYKLGETEFRVSAIPFGGYVEIKGMDPEQMKGEKDEFYSKNVLQKTAVVFAGPFANFSLGFLIFLFVFIFNGVEVLPTTTIKEANIASNLLPNDKILKIDEQKVNNWFEIIEKIQKNSKISLLREGEETDIVIDSLNIDSLIPLTPPIVGNVHKNLPADRAGIKSGSRILKIQDKPINSWDDLTGMIHPAAGETLNVVFLSNKDTIKASIVPDKQKSIEGDSLINIGMIGIETPLTKMKIGGKQAFSLAWSRSCYTALLIYRTFRWLFQRKISPTEVSGPVGIVMISKKSLDRGFIDFLLFVGLITINLAIINLIPIPPLDGFHIVMSLATFTSKKPPSKTLLKIVQTIGTVILLSLMALIIISDVIKGIQGKF